MITFKVVKEQHGWAIRMGERMMMPFWSRDLAIREANCLAAAIRCHGEHAEVIVDGADSSEHLKDIQVHHGSGPPLRKVFAGNV